MEMQKIGRNTRVTVLRGGPSEEYQISLNTGLGVLGALKDSDFNVQDIVISKNGEWISNGIVRSPQDIFAITDVVFIALHGAFGEDGTVQRTIDRLHIPYTGSNALASALAMNKMLTKEQLKKVGIKMAPHMRVTKESADNIPRIVSTIINLFGPEYVIKPISGGSSIGVQIANSPATLINAIEILFQTHDDLLVEQRIVGKEATCGVIENFRNEKLYKLPAIEIIPPKEANFFAADVKYTGETNEICPGHFKTEEKRKLEDLAYTVHKTLNLSQYSRSDFIVADDDIYFLEVNTLPGLTENSLVPKSLAAIGCSYSNFVVHLLTDALNNKR